MLLRRQRLGRCAFAEALFIFFLSVLLRLYFIHKLSRVAGIRIRHRVSPPYADVRLSEAPHSYTSDARREQSSIV